MCRYCNDLTTICSTDLARAHGLVECECGQLVIDGTGKCAACRGRENAPQGAQQALFTPAPAPLAGQLTFLAMDAILATFPPRDATLDRRELPPLPVQVIGITTRRKYSLVHEDHYTAAMAMLSIGTVVGLNRITF